MVPIQHRYHIHPLKSDEDRETLSRVATRKHQDVRLLTAIRSCLALYDVAPLTEIILDLSLPWTTLSFRATYWPIWPPKEASYFCYNDNC